MVLLSKFKQPKRICYQRQENTADHNCHDDTSDCHDLFQLRIQADLFIRIAILKV